MSKYRAIPNNFMTIGEVAKKMGVTVRTLQYYDKEGLLSPSTQSEGGRRLYSNKDLITLHQILSLKSLGFTLDDIKEAQLKLEEKEQKRIKSPYTIIHKKKMSIFPFVITPIVILLLFIVIYVVVSSINKAPIVDTELKSEIRKEFMINEFTY